MLTSIRNERGGIVEIRYEAHTRQAAMAGDRAASPVTVVSSIQSDNGLGQVATTRYEYDDALFRFKPKTAGQEHELSFSGFGKVTEVRPTGDRRVTYFHQGGGYDGAAMGEQADTEWLAGRAYRRETRDASGNVLATLITHWRDEDLGHGRHYAAKEREVAIDHGLTSRATAVEYDWDHWGNQIEEIEYGEVTAADDGSFSDITGDSRRTSASYASPASGHVRDLVHELEITDAAGTVIARERRSYDGLAPGSVAAGDLTSIDRWLDGDNSYVTRGFSYDGQGRLVSRTDARGNATAYAYGPGKLHPSSVTDSVGLVTDVTFDEALGRITAWTEPSGRTFERSYDPFGRLREVRVPDPLNAGALAVAERLTYATQAEGFPTWTRHEAYNAPGDFVETYRYVDGLGRDVQQRTEAASGYVVTDTFHDSSGRQAERTLPYFESGSGFAAHARGSHHGVATTYDALDRPVSQVTPDGQTDYLYGAWTVQVTDPEGRSRKMERDAFGRVASVTEYDGPSAHVTEYAYDELDNLTGITDAAGNQRDFEYDSLKRLVRQSSLHRPASADIRWWTYEHDADGRVTRLVDPIGNDISYAFDAAGRLVSEDLAGTAETELEFSYGDAAAGDAAGRLAGITAADWSKSFGYDALGQQATTILTVDGTDYVTERDLDLAGRVESVRHPDGTEILREYDAGGQVSDILVVDGPSLDPVVSDIEYAPTGLPSSLSYPNDLVTENVFDPAESYRLTGKRTYHRYTGRELQNISYAYDDSGNLASLSDQSDTDTARQAAYSYDGLNRLTDAVVTSAAAGSDYSISYAYDAIGNILSKTADGVVTSYAYQDEHPQAVTQAGQKSYQYDRNGNMTLRDRQVLNWDYKNRLVSVEDTGGVREHYRYDESVARVTATRDNQEVTVYAPNYQHTADTDTKQVLLGGAIVATLESGQGSAPEPAPAPAPGPLCPELDLVGQDAAMVALLLEQSCNSALSSDPGCADLAQLVQRQLEQACDLSQPVTQVHGFVVPDPVSSSDPQPDPEPDPPVTAAGYAMASNSGSFQPGTAVNRVLFHHPDHLGSATLVTDDQSAEALVADYYPFGGERVKQATGMDTPFGYTGQEHEDTGLMYYDARYYDPEIGRFISQDPLVLTPGASDHTSPQSVNAYAYVVNNPVKFVDPLGLDALIFYGDNWAHKGSDFFKDKAQVHRQDLIDSGRFVPGDVHVVSGHSLEEWNAALENESGYGIIDYIAYFGHGNQAALLLDPIPQDEHPLGQKGRYSGLVTNSFDLSGNYDGDVRLNKLRTWNVSRNAEAKLFGCKGAVGEDNVTRDFAKHFGIRAKGARGGVNFDENGRPYVPYKFRELKLLFMPWVDPWRWYDGNGNVYEN